MVSGQWTIISPSHLYPVVTRSNLLHTTQTKNVKLISSLGASIPHLTLEHQHLPPKHPFYVGSPCFDQILWMRTWSAEMFSSKVIGGIWMLNYSGPVLPRELSQMTACRFTTDLSSRCAFPEALQIPKSLGGCFPVGWKSGEAWKGHCLCLHSLRACGMKTGATWVMQVTFLKNFWISEEFRSGHPYAYSKHRQIQPCIYFSEELPKQYSGCRC